MGLYSQLQAVSPGKNKLAIRLNAEPARARTQHACSIRRCNLFAREMEGLQEGKRWRGIRCVARDGQLVLLRLRTERGQKLGAEQACKVNLLCR